MLQRYPRIKHFALFLARQDDAYAERIKTQREQQRDWAVQQLRERALLEAEERELARIQELQMQQNAAVRRVERANLQMYALLCRAAPSPA